MVHNAKNDPLGHVLLEARIRSIPELAASYWRDSQLELSSAIAQSQDFIVTGVGSSWGHALYLTSLLRDYAGREARAVPLSGFLRKQVKRDYSQSILIIFSQGFSENAQIALQHRDKFKHVVLFSASNVAALNELGKAEQAQKFAQLLERDDVSLVWYPLTNEYTLLIRVVGPLLGYLACARFIQALPGNTMPALQPDFLQKILMQDNVDSLLEMFGDRHVRSPLIIANYPLSHFATNLSFKFLEGIFSPGLGICDLLEFAHGPFQQLVANPRPVIVLETRDWLAQLKGRLSEMLEHSGAPYFFLQSQAEQPYAILEYEQRLNWLVYHLARRFQVKQIEWPGRGQDAALYDLSA